MPLFKFSAQLKTAAAKIAYAKVMGRHIHLASDQYAEKSQVVASKLGSVVYGSTEWHDTFAKLKALGVEFDLVDQLEKKAIIFASMTGPFGHFYQLMKLLEHAKLDPYKAIKDPLLMYHYIVGITGCRGVLLPGLHDELIEKLKKAKTAEYQKLLKSKEVQDALKAGKQKLEEICRGGGPVPTGTAVVLMTDMVENMGHVLEKGVNGIKFKTVFSHHTYDPGDSSHLFVLLNGKIVFQNVGLGKSPLPGGDTLNNITAAAMWSVSPISGFACYLADTSGIQNVEEWLIKEKIMEVSKVVNRLRLLGNYMGPWTHWGLDKIRLKEAEAPAKVQEAAEKAAKEAQEALEAYKFDFLSMDQFSDFFVENLETPEEGEKFAEKLMGDQEINPEFWFEEPPSGEHATEELKEGGLYDDFRKLGYTDLTFTSGLDKDPFHLFRSEPEPGWVEPMNKLLAEAMADHMTAQETIKFRESYRNEVEKVIESLTPEERAQPKVVEAAIQTSITLRVFAEAHLSDIRDKVAPQVADKFVTTQKINLGTTPASRVIRNVCYRYEAEIQAYYFAKGSFVDTWNAWLTFEYTISQDAEKLMKERKDYLLKEQQTHAKSLADFEAKHTQEVVEKSEQLKAEKKALEEVFKESEEARKGAEENMKLVEKMKQDAMKHEDEFKKKEEKLHQDKFKKT